MQVVPSYVLYKITIGAPVPLIADRGDRRTPVRGEAHVVSAFDSTH